MKQIIVLGMALLLAACGVSQTPEQADCEAHWRTMTGETHCGCEIRYIAKLFTDSTETAIRGHLFYCITDSVMVEYPTHRFRIAKAPLTTGLTP